MSWVAVAGAAVSVGGALLSKKKAPGVAATEPVNLVNEQQRAIQGNISQESDIETLLSKANSFSQDQANSAMEKAVPGYAGYAKNLLKSGSDALAHPYDLPSDVQANLARISAEKGIAGGTGSGSEFGKFSATRDLGLNMLDYGNSNFAKAIQALTTVTGTAPRISPMSPMSFYVTPAQTAYVAAANNQNAQASSQGGLNAKAAVDNYNTQNLWDSISKSAGPLISAYTGGGGGGKSEGSVSD